MEDALHESSASVESVLDNTTSSVSGALSDTANRVSAALSLTSGNVSNVLSTATGSVQDALNTTTSEVAARLAELRTTAGAEGQRADVALRQTQERMVAEMQKAIEEATRRFNDTATAMRATAKEVGSELEATRAELQRGVVELPEETRASAAAMRRVVAEQIEALSELNAIVRSQSATHDAEERRPAARPAPQAPRQEAYRQPEYRQPEPPRAAPVQQPQPQPQPQQQAPRREAEADVATATRDDNGGWLRDVLRNATAKQQQSGQASLSSLTDEIARSMDEPAFGDAWARYQAGESNVFSRRIYTLSGQSTYDDVRKKLQRDADFARTAQSYMIEFEQLLKRAAAGPRAAAETREYLLSDRGKVYTMLAHASGRLS
jgi:hypothetical protein